MDINNMAFDPLKYGATPVTDSKTGSDFDPTKFGATPVNYTELEKQIEPQKEEGFFNKLGKEIMRTGATAVGTSNPLLGQALKTKTGQEVVSKVLKIGEQNLESTVKPAIQPFAMVSGKNIPLPSGDIVKAEPTPREALGQAVSAGLLVAPVEKVIAPVIKPLARFFSGFTKRVGGALTGKGTEVIEEIIKNPQDAIKGLRGEEIKVLENNAKSATNEIINLSRKNQAEYSQALEDLPKRLGAMPKVMTDNLKTTISVGGQKYTLSKQGVKSFLTEKLRDVGVLVDRSKKFFDFTESPLRKSEEGVLKEIFNLVDDWRDTTPKGLNNLAVKIGNYTKPGEQSATLNGIVGGIKKNIRNYLGNRIPAINEMNAKFHQVEDFTDALRSELGVANNLKTREGLINTANKIQLLFSGNKQLERELIREMQGGGEIIASEAGRQLAQAPSRASVSVGDKIGSFIQAIIPPKAIGEVAVLAGKAKQSLPQIIPTLEKLAPLEREAIFNFIKNLISTDEEVPLQ